MPRRTSVMFSLASQRADASFGAGLQVVSRPVFLFDPAFGAELELLLAANAVEPEAHRRARLRELLARPLNWEAVLRLADHHGTYPLLYQNLSRIGKAVPPSALNALRQRYERNARKSLFLLREFVRILDCFQSNGIEAIPYKGAVLAETVYGDLALRQSGDIDVLIRAADLPRIMAAVAELGYSVHSQPPPGLERAWVASGYECTFDSAAGRNVLEAQWNILPRFYAVDFSMDKLFRRAVTVTVAGMRVQTLSPEDLVLVLSVHAAKHVWGRLGWLVDIAELAKKPKLDWDWIAREAASLGTKRILGVTLLLTERLLDAQIPPSLRNAALADSETQELADEICNQITEVTACDVESASYFRLMMRLRERLADRARFLFRLAFTPGVGEWSAVRLPAPLLPLYRVVRVARLAGKLLRA